MQPYRTKPKEVWVGVSDVSPLKGQGVGQLVNDVRSKSQGTVVSERLACSQSRQRCIQQECLWEDQGQGRSCSWLWMSQHALYALP